MYLRLWFGRYQYNDIKEDKIPAKVQYALECIENNTCLKDKLIYACDERTLVIMNGSQCIGIFSYRTSFETEAVYELHLHPNFVKKNVKTVGRIYFKNAVALIEGMLKAMGYSEAKIWLTENDEHIDIYKECGYKHINDGANQFDESVILLSKYFK